MSANDPLNCPMLIADGGNAPLPESLTRYTGFLVAKAHQRLFVMFNEECQKIGLEVPCPGILHLLVENGPMSQQQLGKVLRIDRTTMVKLVDALEAHHFACRKDHPEDRRAYLVEITDLGRKALHSIENVADQLEANLLAQFTEPERKIIRRGLLTLAG